MLPTSPSEAPRSDTLSLARESSRVADAIKWSRPPEMGDVGGMAELGAAADYYSLGDLADASTAGRNLPNGLLRLAEGSRARVMRRIRESRAGRQLAHHGKRSSFQEADALAEIKSKPP